MINETDRRLAEKFSNSVVGAMSLGSKELFHSNVWAWVLEQYPEFAETFFEGLENVHLNHVDIKREQGHRDLTIWRKSSEHTGGENVYVIENKFKAIPTRHQLLDYQKKLCQTKKGCDFHGVLTGLSCPQWMNENNAELTDWRFVSYDDILKGLENVLTKKAIGNSVAALREYVEMTRTLVKLVKMFDKDVGETMLVSTNEWAHLMEEIRIDDLCKKMKADQFVSYIEASDWYKKFSESTFLYGLKPYVISDYTNNDALVDVGLRRTTLKEGKRVKEMTDEAIGIQIQGGMYKKFFMAKGSAGTVYEKACKLNWLSNQWMNENQSGKGRRKDGRFKQYDQGGGYFFVYHDRKLTDVSFDKIGKCIKGDLATLVQVFANQP